MNTPIKDELLEHASEEQGHADQIATQMVQPKRAARCPATLTQRSHDQYDSSDNIKAMIRANLIAECLAIEPYRQMIKIGGTAPTTKLTLMGIMAKEEEHADDMRDLLD